MTQSARPTPPDLRPRWVSGSPANPPSGTSLLDQLLETGLLEKELVMPDSTYRIVTRFTFRRDARLFRTVVLRDGRELQDGAWPPTFRDRTDLARDRDEEDQKIELAREALESHLSLAARVAQDLQETRTHKRPGNLIGLAAAGIGIAVVVGTVVFREELSTLLSKPETGLAAEQAAAVAADEAGAPAISYPDDLVEVESGVNDEPLPEDSSEPSKRANSVTESKQRLDSLTVSPARSVKSPEPQMPTPLSAKESPPVSSVQAESVLSQEVEDPDAKADQPEVLTSALVGNVQPATHYQVSIEQGNRVYDGQSILFSEFPKSLRGRLCLTSARSEGDQDGGFVIELLAPATLWIAHDRRIKKKPVWLSTFTPSGYQIMAHVVDDGETIVYDLYSKKFAGGSVMLGSNTRQDGFTLLREISSKRKAMYLVCVE